MSVNFNSVNQVLPLSTPQGQTKVSNGTDNVSFSDFMKKALNELNDAQNNSDKMTNQLINGENVDLHNVMIAAEKASVLLQTTIEVRNKAVEAYQEVMRMNM